MAKNKSPFTRENFTFFKQPISEPPYETVRNAGRSLNSSHHHHKKRKKKTPWDDDDDDDLPDDEQPFDKPEIVIERDTDDVVSPLVIPTPQEKVVKVKTSRFKLTPMRSVMKQNTEKPNPVVIMVSPKTEPVEEKKVLTAEDVLSSPLITEEMLMKDTDNHTEDITVENDTNSEYTDGEPPAKKYKPTARKSTTQKVFRSPFRNNIRR